MTRQERRERDVFFSGYTAALAAALDGELGDATQYVYAVSCAGPKELLNFARRTNDPQLPKIRAAVRFIDERRGVR